MKTNMKMPKRLLKLLWTAVLTASCFCCSPQKNVERVLKNGTEVVLNHVEPYRLKGEPSTFSLETVMTIDMERDDLAEKGMGSAGEFGVDAGGNIYIVGFKNEINFIYRFDSKGDLLNSFGRRGQGPGEIEWPFLDSVSDRGQIALSDLMQKYIVFDKDGNLVQEVRPRFPISYVFPLENDKFLVERPRYDKTTAGDSPFPYTLSLCDSSFNEIKELDRHQWNSGNERLVPFFMWRVSAGHVYVANEERGYEILDYDLEGNLRRKIRKAYRPVVVTEEIKKAILGPGYGQPGISHNRYFPNPLPPLSFFFVDDEGRIFVMTYESGERPGEYIYDIFNAKGVFIGRRSLEMIWAGIYGGPKYAMAKKGLLYYYREKESGFRELIVQKIIWKK